MPIVVAVTSIDLVGLIMGTVDLDASEGGFGSPWVLERVFDGSRNSDADSLPLALCTAALFHNHGRSIFPFPLSNRFVLGCSSALLRKRSSSIDIEDTAD